MRPDFRFLQIAAGNLDIAVVGQLAATELPLGDQFESGSVKVVGFEAAFRRRGLGKRRETRTTPSYSPTPMPNSTAFRSEFHRASGGKRKNTNLLGCSANVLINMLPVHPRSRVPLFS
jgi:hypothetical protein